MNGSIHEITPVSLPFCLVTQSLERHGFYGLFTAIIPICFECFRPKIPTKVLLKGGRTLDALAVATGVAFDKSGGSETPWDDSRSLYSSTSIGETGTLYIFYISK